MGSSRTRAPAQKVPASSAAKLVVGRVGLLAAAFGIGVATLAFPGAAAAEVGGSPGASGADQPTVDRVPAQRSRVAARPSTRQRGAAPSTSAATPGPRRGAAAARRTPLVSGAVVGLSAGHRAANSDKDALLGERGAEELPRAVTHPAGTAPGQSTPTSAVAVSAAAQVAGLPAGASGNGGAAAVLTPPARAVLVRAAATAEFFSAATNPLLSRIPVASTPVPPLLQAIDNQVQAGVRTVFNALINWTSTMPVNPLTNWLEGGLLLIRKSLFNQTAGVRSVQMANSPALVTGTIEVVDPEGDGWMVELVSGPSHGSVALGTTSQYNGIGSTNYSYTPGQSYSGEDRFVVKITGVDSGFNILHPFGVLNTRYYTVAVGDAAEAAKARFNAERADPKDTLDTHLFLSDAAVTVTVKKHGVFFPKYMVSVTLPASTSARSFAWMDTRGNIGSVPVDTMLVDDWAAYSKKAAENGTTPLLAFSYSDDNTQKAVFVDVGAVTKNADGSFTVSGELRTDTNAQDGRVDMWDFVGINYKGAYENFLNASGLKECASGQVCSTVSAVGVLGATSLSPSAFAASGGHDYPLPKARDGSATQTSPGSMGPGTTGVNEGNGTAVFGSTGAEAPVELTAMIPWGTDGSFISATNLTQDSTAGNGIFLYTNQAPLGSAPKWERTQLADNSWNAAVNAMVAYDQVLTDATGTPIPTTYIGTSAVLNPKPAYPLTGTISALNSIAVFTASISPGSVIYGTEQLPAQMTVTEVASGAISVGASIISGPGISFPIQILSANSGNAASGVGSYVTENPVFVDPDQPPPPPLTGTFMTEGRPGNALQLSLASLTAAGVSDPRNLLGATVTGTVVSAVITAYSGTSGSTANYILDTSALVYSEALTVTTFSGPVVKLSVPGDVNPASLIGQSITGEGIAPDTVITGFVSYDVTGTTYSVNNPIKFPTVETVAAVPSIAVTLPNIPTTRSGVVVGLSDGSVQYWNGGAAAPELLAAADQPGWTQLQITGGWGEGVAVNAVVALPNNQGFAVGLSNGEIAIWNNPILADGTVLPGPGAGGGCSTDPTDCWSVLPAPLTGRLDSVSAMIPSGQNGGLIVAGPQSYNGSVFGQTHVWDGFDWQVQLFETLPTTLLPYDGTTFVGAIGGAPAVADLGVISAPSYAPLLSSPESAAAMLSATQLAAATAGCQTSYGGGSGTGCSGYVLTVQQAAGAPIRVGQTVYGGTGTVPGTTITAQISDGSGNLCSASCNSGGTGVYLVSTSQLVAPGTPMSASDGSGYVVGMNDGEVWGLNNGLEQMVPPRWVRAINTLVPWRDGFVAGLDNGAVMYWSPSNNPGGNNPDNPNALDYAGSTIPTQLDQPAGWSQLQGPIGNAVTSMVQVGDGFALGQTAPNNTDNGAIQLFTGFGSVSAVAPFGYLPLPYGTPPAALTPDNSFTSIGGGIAPSGPNGSVQQLLPMTRYVTDAFGFPALAGSVVAGLTNDGTYAWAGSTANISDTDWKTLQESESGGLDPELLKAAWEFGTGKPSQTWSGPGYDGTGGVGATWSPAANGQKASGDPVFGQASNQAWCGSSCSSNGDYSAFVIDHPFGKDGVLTSFGTTLEGKLNLAALGYGYVFVPNGFLDKFESSKYSVGLVLALQGGPSVWLNPPKDAGDVTETVTLPGYAYNDVQETEFGTFGESLKLDASVTGKLVLKKGGFKPLELAHAFYTPGLLFSWNTVDSPDQIGLQYSAFPSVAVVTSKQIEEYFDPTGDITLTAKVTPSAQASYGLYTPPSFPISLDVFKLTVGYANPITATLKVPLKDDAQGDPTLSVTSQGFFEIGAAFVPQVTSALSWNGKYQVYSAEEEFTL